MKIIYYTIVGSQLPVDKVFSIGNQKFLFRFRENKVKGFLTLEILDTETKSVIMTNKLTYGMNVIDYKLSGIIEKIIPLNIDYESAKKGISQVTKNSLGESVLLISNIL